MCAVLARQHVKCLLKCRKLISVQTDWLCLYKVFLMADLNNQNEGDATADAVAVIAVVVIILTGVIYWLSTL